MHRRVGNYLLQGPPPGDGPVVAAASAPGVSLLIVEPRESFWLDKVIANAVREFPDSPLFVCAPAAVLDYLRPLVPTMREIRADFPARTSAATFSALMFQPELWAAIPTPHVLLFQTDAVLVPGAAARLLATPGLAAARDVAFLGPACGNCVDDSMFVINGGLSLRRVAAFAEAVGLLTDADRALPEDAAFCAVMRRHPARFALPTMAECNAFAIESFGDPSTVIGIHGTDKYYCPPALLTATLGTPGTVKIVDIVTFDGEPVLVARLKLLDAVVDRFVLIEARHTHAGAPKALEYRPAAYARWAHKITHVIIDAFPPAPPGWGDDQAWVLDNAEAWWRESYQRDAAARVPGIDDSTVCLVSDVDEIPDPSALLELVHVHAAALDEGPVHLDMAHLVHAPVWESATERWTKAFAARFGHLAHGGGPTRVRCGPVARVLPRAGWHCSSFFDVDRQIRKVQSYAHREFAREVDPEVIRERFATGRDPYGRGPQFDCRRAPQHGWLAALL